MTVDQHVRPAKNLRIELPRFSGGRARARAIIENQGADLRGAQVILDCRGLSAGTGSFADELVLGTLVQGSAVQLVVEYPPNDFIELISSAARNHGVSEKLHII